MMTLLRRLGREVLVFQMWSHLLQMWNPLQGVGRSVERKRVSIEGQ